MGVHDSSSQLHQLADMACQKNSFRSVFHSGVNGLPEKIAVLYRILQKLRMKLIQIIQSIISRHQHQISAPPGQLHFDIHPDRLNQGLLTHRLHDAAGTQHGDAAHNPQAGIEGLHGQCFSSRNRDRHRQTALVTKLPADLLHVFPDHLPGNLVDCCRAHGLFQPGPCHAAHALSAIDLHPRLFTLPHHCIDLQSICHIRIISRILPNRAGSLFRRPLRLQHFQIKPDSFRRHQLYLRHRLSGQEHAGRGLGGRGRAGAGGVAHTQFFIILKNIFFHTTQSFLSGPRLRAPRTQRMYAGPFPSGTRSHSPSDAADT